MATPQYFPKSARLLKKRDFRRRSDKRFFTRFFCFQSSLGSGRLGISISKKVLKLAVARNRIKRLIRETFRKEREKYGGVDVHVIALASLKNNWVGLKQSHVVNEFTRWSESLLKTSADRGDDGAIH